MTGTRGGPRRLSMITALVAAWILLLAGHGQARDLGDRQVAAGESQLVTASGLDARPTPLIAASELSTPGVCRLAVVGFCDTLRIDVRADWLAELTIQVDAPGAGWLYLDVYDRGDDPLARPIHRGRSEFTLRVTTFGDESLWLTIANAWSTPSGPYGVRLSVEDLSPPAAASRHRGDSGTESGWITTSRGWSLPLFDGVSYTGRERRGAR